MASKDYKLPFSPTGYEVRCSMIAKGWQNLYWKSVKVEHVPAEDVPTSVRRYRLYRTEAKVRSGKVEAEVLYQILKKR
jgi:hypothetical protein